MRQGRIDAKDKVKSYLPNITRSDIGQYCSFKGPVS